MATKITFPAFNGRRELVIRKITEVHIENTYKELTSTAEIVMPRNIKFFDNGVMLNKYDVKKIFRSGDPVIIEMGYGTDSEILEEFTGYVSFVSADIPMTIKCEDEMYKLKRIPVNYVAANVTLDKMLRDICPGYEVDALEGVSLGGVRFAKTTVAKVLEKLQGDPWHLYSYMDGKKLVCGKYYSENSSLKPLNFDLEKNVVSNDLTYKSADEILLKITAKSIMPNGDKIQVEIGEDGGDKLELTYYNIATKQELKAKAQIDYDRRKQGGFEGSITVFGKPSAKPGMKINITSKLYPDRNGVHYIEGVNKDFDEPKYRQTIKLGAKVE